MSLLTPPSSSHRSDKENRLQLSRSRVAWSQHDQIHNISASPQPLKCSSANRDPPTKSILKKTSYPVLPLLDPELREETPEPEDTLMDLHYLEGPVLTILSPLATMKELNEAYGRLMVRLRAAVLSSTDADASWPLFQPLRQSKVDFVAAVVRDLRRALENPAGKFPDLAGDSLSIEHEGKLALSLPSPKSSPKKKGMTAEQVKHARDLCTTSHSAMKFLALIMGLPAVYGLFTNAQLRELLSEVLAIPTAEVLPTPNARKTCALAIWVIQIQRLPTAILQPLSDRIAYVIRRGLDGELGKEGKKGSTSDGLKAIHDLSVFQPVTFIPAFTNILDSVLVNLLAPTLALRLQACHALGGIVLGLVSLPRSSIHTRISNLVAEYITRVPTSPKATSSPSKLVQEAPIFRTLRATLNALEPVHAAQGPVWALIVLSCFVILLGPTLIHNPKIFRSISSLLSLPMRHKKSSVRALGCMVWRSIAWVYFLPHADTSRENSLALDMLKDKHDSLWKAMLNVVDVQTGMAFIAALLGDEGPGVDDGLMRSMTVMENMLAKQQNVYDVIETMKRLVSLEINNTRWHVNKLIMPAIFASNPGLLTVEYKSLSNLVNGILLQRSPLEDIRYLTREEIAQEWVFDGMVKLWKQSLANLKKFDEAEVPNMRRDLLSVWQGLISAFGSTLQEVGDEDGTVEFARKASDVLVDILEDTDLDLMPSLVGQKSSGSCSSDSLGTLEKSNGELKLHIVSEMWGVARTILPESSLRRAGERLLSCLTKIEDELVESNNEARVLWVSLCVKALSVCDVDATKVFWGFDAGGCEWDWNEEVRNVVWGISVEKWANDGCNWEGAVVLLAVPFTSAKAQNFGTENTKKWEDFLQYAFNKALDYGFDSIIVLDSIAGLLLQQQDLSGPASTRIADLLMSHLDVKEIREIPETLMEFVNNAMRAVYPPEAGNHDISRWMIRTLTNVIEGCPSALASRLLELVQEGVCLWVSDEHAVWSADDYELEIVPLYAQALFCIQSLRPSMENLEKFAGLIESGFAGRCDKPQLVKDQFEGFWNAVYGTWQTPVNGWPEGIQRCLAASIRPTTSIDPTIDGKITPVSIPMNPVAGTLQPHTPEPIIDNVPKTPMTPTAPRITSVFGSQNIAEHLFPGLPPTISPTSPLRIRTPSTPKRAGKRTWGSASASAPKRRRIEEGEDKENASPRVSAFGPVFSVAERIAMRSPLAATSVMSEKSSRTGKRRLEAAGDAEANLGIVERPSPLKRGRMNGEATARVRASSACSTASEDSLEEEDVAASLLTLRSSSPVPSRPRRRLLLESVEVPSFEEVLLGRRLRRSVSLGSLVDSTVKTPSKVGRLTHNVRLGKSMKKMDAVFGPLVPSLSSNDGLRLPSCGGVIKLTRAASDPRIAPSSSSDDDPRYGQVTPHHLLSPAPRKVLNLFDPPSDDSLPSSSPTKEVASRRAQRQRSLAEIE